jgi:hypothetical protein
MESVESPRDKKGEQWPGTVLEFITKPLLIGTLSDTQIAPFVEHQKSPGISDGAFLLLMLYESGWIRDSEAACAFVHSSF